MDQDTIDQHPTPLVMHRRTLEHLVQQAAQFGGEVFAPPQTVNGIAGARAEIRHIKAALRACGFEIADQQLSDAFAK